MADFLHFDQQPWRASYGTAIVAELPEPRYQNLAQMVHSACERFAKQILKK